MKITDKGETYSSDGRRWSTALIKPLAEWINNSRLNQRYSTDTIPDWEISSSKEMWWVKKVSTLEEIHRNTFGLVLDNGILGNPDTIENHRRRFLREIDIRGPDIKSEKLGYLKSSILLRRDVPIKSFQIDNINYGGGGGGQ